MGLTKIRLGELIELCVEKNSNGYYKTVDVRGVNNLKQFIETKADLNGRDLCKFQIVNPKEFVFNHRTSRNGSKFSIAYNNGDKPIICTEDYVVFKISDEAKRTLSDEWLYMFFNRPEFDRFVITNSWGSSTEFFNWEDICDIEIEIPPFLIQQKYVDVYNSMLSNQKNYGRGLVDLKLVCDAYFDRIKRADFLYLGEVIEKKDIVNTENNYCMDDVKGMTITKEIIPTKANVKGADLSKYIVVEPYEFVYNPRTHGKRIGLGYNNTDKAFIISWNNIAFKIKEEKKELVLADYLFYFFKRDEWDREACFRSWGSSTEVLSWEELCDMKIPCPSISIQKIIAEIESVYNIRKNINEKLKNQIMEICPILIKGSLEEALR